MARGLAWCYSRRAFPLLSTLPMPLLRLSPERAVFRGRRVGDVGAHGELACTDTRLLRQHPTDARLGTCGTPAWLRCFPPLWWPHQLDRGWLARLRSMRRQHRATRPRRWSFRWPILEVLCGLATCGGECLTRQSDGTDGLLCACALPQRLELQFAL